MLKRKAALIQLPSNYRVYVFSRNIITLIQRFILSTFGMIQNSRTQTDRVPPPNRMNRPVEEPTRPAVQMDRWTA